MLFVALLHLATPLEPPQVPRLNLYPPRRVALLVEPTPFTHISGYSNRFKEMLRFLVAAGDEVHRLVVRCLRWLAVKLADALLPRLLNCADLTLATSPQLQQQLRALGCRRVEGGRVEVWRKGVDTLTFSPAFNASNSHARHALTGGQPHRPPLLSLDSPLLLYVGRLGAEKRVELLRPGCLGSLASEGGDSVTGASSCCGQAVSALWPAKVVTRSQARRAAAARLSRLFGQRRW
ncbi:hypothetical protein EMIHUDRAFT_223825 [Emiliania huxleyi CCMP1516]|uniref:Uncharacterized protein n=2 Tax=Emiliania huxleyi TaxID=2903 RepID=A0A0D3KTA1_EMIH1|nr:hypothetical protein EMIHUDRAFT_223825 [Emiliania huxleyi CCMP1516]EOD38986.1 hypothetical protein EMIHUDRAFT_223825 [Emiliania huxleyi CCMP1516]|eukprot:XP_005791415.1 hypothetical protein EMIHUDRAFT_223825 [Emiliania huxleyi CCMP1516]